MPIEIASSLVFSFERRLQHGPVDWLCDTDVRQDLLGPLER